MPTLSRRIVHISKINSICSICNIIFILLYGQIITHPLFLISLILASSNNTPSEKESRAGPPHGRQSFGENHQAKNGSDDEVGGGVHDGDLNG